MMKKFGILILMFVLGVVFATTLKAQDVEKVIVMDSISQNQKFVEHPYLYKNVFADPWAKTTLLQQDYETFNRVWDYQKKQTREMVWGLGIGAVGIAGMVYAVNMPTPVRQVNNPALDDEANKAQRDRRIVGVASIGIGAIGGLIFARSFRWTRRLNAEVGIQSLRLEYNLTGNRRYFKGKAPKKFMRTRYHRRNGYIN